MNSPPALIDLLVEADRPLVNRNREFIAVLALTTAMSALAIDTLLPAFPEIRAHYALASNSTRVSLLITAFFLGSGIAHIPMGILADRFGRKLTLYASLGICLGWRAAVLFPGVVASALAVWLIRIPETLPPERRRTIRARTLAAAFRDVTRVRSSVLLALAVTCLLAVINTYISLAEIITDKVYGRAAQFPVTFGAIAVAMGLAGVINARLVGQVGLRRMLRRTPLLLATTGVAFASVSLLTGGRPSFYFYGVSLAAVLGFQVLVLPNCNSLALQPLGHVAGLASGMISSVSTIGGAVLGGLVAQQYSGNTNALAIGIAAFTSVAFFLTRAATHSVSVNPG